METVFSSSTQSITLYLLYACIQGLTQQARAHKTPVNTACVVLSVFCFSICEIQLSLFFTPTVFIINTKLKSEKQHIL